MIIEAIRSALGYVRFSIKGEFPERLLNQLAIGGVSVWGIKRQGDKISACILKKDYLKIRKYRAKNRVTTRITARYGLPFKLQRHRLRVGFAAGLVLYVAALNFMSSFVWNVRVVGNEALSSEEVLAVCEELGLKEGVFKSTVNAEQLRNGLALKLDKVSWASVNLEGVRATVNISEISGTKNESPKPSNLVADRDGVVTALEVTSGSIAVKIGQTVKKGDLLVSGITEYKDGTYHFGPSAGNVLAETDRELEVIVPFSQCDTVRIGKPETKQVISFFGLNIPVYLGSVKGAYEVETTVKRYDDGEMYLPIYLTEAVFYKTAQNEYNLSEAEAKERAEKQLRELEEAELENAEIVSRSTEFSVLPDGIKLTAKYKCKENIARPENLLILE